MAELGRPTKFTQETIDKLIVAIKKGAPYEIACNYAGISYELFRQWVVRAKEGKEDIFVAFLANIKEAEGHTALIWLDKIDKAMADGAWQAAAWKLERRHYKHFSSQIGVMELSERLDKLEKSKPESDEEIK